MIRFGNLSLPAEVAADVAHILSWWPRVLYEKRLREIHFQWHRWCVVVYLA
jgi:hypothetical protein